MRKYGLFLVSVALVAVPAVAQTYGGGSMGMSAGTAGSPSSYAAIGGVAGVTPTSSFSNADGPTQLAAHKARWARIEARRAQRALEKAQKQKVD